MYTHVFSGHAAIQGSTWSNRLCCGSSTSIRDDRVICMPEAAGLLIRLLPSVVTHMLMVVMLQCVEAFG